jgi:hypothetical protein
MDACGVAASTSPVTGGSNCLTMTLKQESNMRELKTEEQKQVSGAGKPCPPVKKKGNNGFGNGGHDGVPGKSGKQDRTR